MKKKVTVNDMMQKDYSYYITEPMGKKFDHEFKPDLTPKQMLKLGVFGGKYMTDCKKEFPKDWYKEAKLCREFHDPKLNLFKINASKPLSIGKIKAGSIKKIPAAGFNGIVDISWEEDALTMKGRSKDGKP